MQSQTNILLDSDILIHFHKADKIFDLPDFFKEAKCILLDVVWEELKRTPIAFSINLLREKGLITFVELPIEDDLIDSEYEYLRYMGKGRGESACMAYAKYNKDHIIASSNLRDLLPYCEKNHISYLTTMDFLCHALQNRIFTLADCNDFIAKVLKKGSILPVQKMEDYDCIKRAVLKPTISPK